MMRSISLSTSFDKGSSEAPFDSAIERSEGPRNNPSTPGVAAIASMLASAVRVSIMASVTVRLLASAR